MKIKKVNIAYNFHNRERKKNMPIHIPFNIKLSSNSKHSILIIKAMISLNAYYAS